MSMRTDRERQHYEEVPFFDKPDRLTANGICRDPRSTNRIYYRINGIPVIDGLGCGVTVVSTAKHSPSEESPCGHKWGFRVTTLACSNLQENAATAVTI